MNFIQNLKIIGSFVLFLTLIGCAGMDIKEDDNYYVTLNSEPSGATVICNNQNFGYTPETVVYKKEAIENQATLRVGCIAKWASGAENSYLTSPVSLEEFPKGVQITLQRPNHPNYQVDLDFSLKVAAHKAEIQRINNETARIQAETARINQEATSRAIQGIADSLNNGYRRYTPKTSTTSCYGLGNSVNCMTTGY